MPVHVFAEIENLREVRALPRADSLNVQWLTRTSGASETLVDAIGDFAWPTGNGRVYVGCETGAMRRIRTLLLDRGFDRAQITTRGYWRVGASNHPDHDYGDD